MSKTLIAVAVSLAATLPALAQPKAEGDVQGGQRGRQVDDQRPSGRELARSARGRCKPLRTPPPAVGRLLMFPILLVMYGRLAATEDAEMQTRFGDGWQRYAAVTPRYFPAWRRHAVS